MNLLKSPQPLPQCSRSDMKGKDVTEPAKADSNKILFDFHTTEISRHQRILTSLCAGAIAGAVAKTTIAPFDRTKINFQVSPDKVYSFRGALRFIKKTYKQDGFFALWRGNSATMVRIVPHAAIQYCAYEQYKQLLLKEGEKYLPPPQRYITGSLAGVTASSITYPLDVARARMAVTQKGTYSSLIEVFLKIYRTEGLLTLYKGYLPTLLGVIPYAGTSFFTFESLKKYYTDQTGNTHINHFYKLGFGALAGLLGQSASYPFDIVRRRMQTAGVLGMSHVYTSCWVTFLTIYKTEGIKRGLYKGLSMNWIKGPISVGVSFTVYELVLFEVRKYIFHQKNTRLFSSQSDE